MRKPSLGFVAASLAICDLGGALAAWCLPSCFEDDGREGIEAARSRCAWAASVSVAFSGAMVEISSLGPKSKPKLKLVSKEVSASSVSGFFCRNESVGFCVSVTSD